MALDVSQVLCSALSRLRSLNGLVLLPALRMNGISDSQDVMDYTNNKAVGIYVMHLHFSILFINIWFNLLIE
jgi:hypothetical protein